MIVICLLPHILNIRIVVHIVHLIVYPVIQYRLSNTIGRSQKVMI
ncbi:unnamed protein product [Schistosoma curassoni]|uniref:Uncharacterized protein n=1 Tax=Schistosoma curassoni TaxID=6186 RepID=A0A183L205_9TREM|nr:unnamed protein product [Schistosoma curassoni]